MNRQEKSEEIGALKQLLDGAQLAVVADYTGLNVLSMVELRTELRKSEARYRVVKNTLAKLALEDTALAPLNEQLSGPVGIAYTLGDAAGTAKAISSFAKTHPQFKIRGGVMSDGTVLDEAGVEILSNLPSKDQLRAMLLGTLMGVPQKFVGTLAAVPGGFVRVLEARRKQLAGEA
jgi:large subunit ribosomal protein L10